MTGGLSFELPDATREASTGAFRRHQRATAAGREIVNDRNKAERETVKQLLKRLGDLKTSLQQRLLASDGSVTDFRRFSLQSLLADVDRLIANATVDLAKTAQQSYDQMAQLGDEHATQPLRAAQLNITRATPGIDHALVTAAFGNTVDLLTAPMQQFATDVKVSLRRVALAGDSRFEEIQRLRDKIAGQGFGAAQYKAERIVRTELSRVFNQSTYDRMLALSKDFPFLRKGWRSSKDNRVRLGHTEAGQTYGRGRVIPMAERFQINVHDERGKGGPKLIGVASLRFPVDPDASPGGKIAAGATIMCRCNGFVDFDPAQFAAFTAAKVQTALTGTKLPKPTPAPALPKQKTARVPKIKVPKVATPTAADLRPTPAAPEPKTGPTGPTVSSALNVQAGYDLVAKALAEIDKVHGDGNLPKIDTGAMPKRYQSKAAAAYFHADGQSKYLGFTKKLLTANPFMTVFHEVGHFLDHKAFGAIGGGYASETLNLATGAQSQAIRKVMAAIKASEAIQTLNTWNQAYLPGSGLAYGDGVVPAGVSRPFVTYLLKTKETFARAYAQYMAETSAHPAALKALRNMQAGSTTGPVAKETPYNKASTTRGEVPTPGSWGYPWQWSDKDFAPIRAAFDDLVKAMGWQK